MRRKRGKEGKDVREEIKWKERAGKGAGRKMGKRGREETEKMMRRKKGEEEEIQRERGK